MRTKDKVYSFIILLLSTILVILSSCTNKTPENKIIKSYYNIPTNSFSVIYTQDKDTFALDYLHPIELDSLINELNKQ